MKMRIKITRAAAAAAIIIGMTSSPGRIFIDCMYWIMDMYVSWCNKPKVTYYLHWAIIDALTRNIQNVAVLVSQVQLAAANHVLELCQGRGLGPGVQLRVGHEVEADLNASGPSSQVLNVGVLGVEKISQLLPETGFKGLLVGLYQDMIVLVYPRIKR